MSERDNDQQKDSKRKSKGLPIAWLLIGLAVVVMACGVGWDLIASKAPEIKSPDLSQIELPAGVTLPEGVDPDVLKGLALDSNAQVPESMKGLQDLIDDIRDRARGTTPGATGPAPTESTETDAAGDKPEAVFRLGFGFAAGFAAAFALRKVFKVTVFAAGLVVLLLLGLEQAELIDIQWGAMADRYDSFEEWAAGQVSSVRALLTGAIPMTATAVAGLAAGWKAG